MTSGLALFARWSDRQKLNRVSPDQFRYVALYAPLKRLWQNLQNRQTVTHFWQTKNVGAKNGFQFCLF